MSVTPNRPSGHQFDDAFDDELDDELDDDIDSDVGYDDRRSARPSFRAQAAYTHAASRNSSRGARRERPGRGQHRTVLSALRQLPNFLRLLYGLLTDSRVSTTDKLLVGGAVAYFIAPIDIIPDAIPFLGEIDDLFLLILALKRIIKRADPDVVLDHWMGDPDDLSDLRLEQVLAAAAFFLPKRFRRRLRIIGRL
jgi:uncharacterized membrane protein YkvA (DUF1232 family)